MHGNNRSCAIDIFCIEYEHVAVAIAARATPRVCAQLLICEKSFILCVSVTAVCSCLAVLLGCRLSKRGGLRFFISHVAVPNPNRIGMGIVFAVSSLIGPRSARPLA